MKGLAVSEIPDLVNSTLPHFKNRGKFEAAFELQQYYFLDEVFQKDKYQVQDGRSIEFNVVLDDNGTARHTKLFSTRTRNMRDVLKQGSQNWCFADAEAYYEAHLLTMNRGASAKAKYIKIQYFAAYKSLANLLERRAVLAPEDANDQENPNGLLWWFSMLASGQQDDTGGFNGKLARYGDGTTTTTIGGIDANLNPLWRNWVATYSGVIDIDTTNTLRRGMIATKFVRPKSVKDLDNGGPASKWRVLWSLRHQAEYEELVNSGSDKRNGDLNPFADMITFRGVRTVGLPTLETVSNSPIIVCNFAHFMPCVHSDWWMKEDEPMRDVDQRHVYVQGIDCQYNYLADNRREMGFILHTKIA